MTFTRRELIAGTFATVVATPSAAQPKGIDAARFGVRANAEGEQTQALQKAIDEAARAGQPLWLGLGRYRTGPLRLAPGLRIIGADGETTLRLVQGAALFTAQDARDVTLQGLTLDGQGAKPGNDGALGLTRIFAADVAAGLGEVLGGTVSLARAVLKDEGTGLAFLPRTGGEAPGGSTIQAALFAGPRRFGPVIVDGGSLPPGGLPRRFAEAVDDIVLVVGEASNADQAASRSATACRSPKPRNR